MGYETSLSGNNLAFLESLYEAYQADPDAVDPAWVPLFRELESGSPAAAEAAAEAAVGESAAPSRVDNLIEAYRHYGHMKARLDPLGRPRRHVVTELDPAFHGLGDGDMDRVFDAGTLLGGQRGTLREIYSRLENTYSRHVGVEYLHIRDSEQRAWLQSRMEACENQVVPEVTEQRRLLSDLVQIENVDKFIHSKFLGAKRFSISGAESIIALLDCIIEEGGALGVDELVLGMAHRGRLNVLMNIMGKKPEEVFSEFEKANPWESLGSGDVKYHLGHHRFYTTRGGQEMYLALAFNPSHLEAITPVIQGRVRAKQDTFADVAEARARVMGVTLHGDAAFAGQGVVQETFNFSRLRGYDVGGVIRIVTNNQVGFTTDPHDSRSTTYATDIAHAMQVPVFHVNGDDIEAAAYVAKLAMGFRQRFGRDVIIDLICYRRFGHNEGDDPTFTQPEMYKLIDGHPSVRALYEQRLIERGTVTREDCERIDKNWTETYDIALDKAKKAGGTSGKRPMHGVWERYQGGLESETPDVPTSISPEQLDHLRQRLVRVPEDFKLHRKLRRLLKERDTMWRGEQPINWACGELMALGSLLAEGARVRFSGQDSQRGTFSHRHAVYRDNETGAGWSPLDHLAEKQGRFEIFNSPLSEFSVLGFEFGYSLMAPDCLVVWEAQFGD
ncbi:MAG: 2-oxoglutarate dehydrogenase E1 component, partial [Myxococcales bacterium]|nr:2-oxoglutarate dehydrogenase E1 component [Myxococcales bacterium]